MENFERNKTTANAYTLTRRFLKDFVPGGESTGLLFTGSVGTGKTHLAVAAARDMVERLGVEARFVDVRALLDRLRSSYADDAAESHEQILRPILKADLVVIDELGAARPTDWTFETLELLIGGLYNRLVPVIVTTNLPNLGPGATVATAGEYARAARVETLGDRIGTRMWSRLQQMCVSCEMVGPDWRGKR
jgi:DNA replication protein DnaC